MKKETLEADAAKWDKVYEQTEPEKLPWFGHIFPPQVDTYLSGLNQSDFMLVTGCGAGDTVKILQVKGFSNIKGTDISTSAIEIAKKRYPDLDFESIATEDLIASKELKDINVIDWLNLHQVQSIEGYLSSLGTISKNLFIAWIYDSNKESFADSYVHDGKVYYHNPEIVQKILQEKGLTLKEQFDFSFSSNSQAAIVREHKAIGQIYERK